MCCACGGLAATRGVLAHAAATLSSAGPALAQRKGIGIVSLLPRAMRELFVRMYLPCPGNLDVFRKEAVWR